MNPSSYDVGTVFTVGNRAFTRVETITVRRAIEKGFVDKFTTGFPLVGSGGMNVEDQSQAEAVAVDQNGKLVNFSGNCVSIPVRGATPSVLCDESFTDKMLFVMSRNYLTGSLCPLGCKPEPWKVRRVVCTKDGARDAIRLLRGVDVMQEYQVRWRDVSSLADSAVIDEELQAEIEAARG